jgi:hypothetical protein
MNISSDDYVINISTDNSLGLAEFNQTDLTRNTAVSRETEEDLEQSYPDHS